jgi:hypothetical protein
MKPTPEEKCSVLTVEELFKIVQRESVHHVNCPMASYEDGDCLCPRKQKSQRLAQAIHAKIVKPSPSPEAIYPCADCGVMRTKDEGGTTFTVCDKCWDKKHKPSPEAECNHDYVISPEEGILHCTRCGRNTDKECGPAPEARVDWEKELEMFCAEIHDLGMRDEARTISEEDSEYEYKKWVDYMKDLFRSAAFEKGREAR